MDLKSRPGSTVCCVSSGKPLNLSMTQLPTCHTTKVKSSGQGDVL